MVYAVHLDMRMLHGIMHKGPLVRDVVATPRVISIKQHRRTIQGKRSPTVLLGGCRFQMLGEMVRMKMDAVNEERVGTTLYSMALRALARKRSYRRGRQEISLRGKL
jgi:hypothetical protein